MCKGCGYSPSFAASIDAKISSQRADEVSTQKVELGPATQSAKIESDLAKQVLLIPQPPSPPKVVENASAPAKPSDEPNLVPEAMKDVFTAGLSVAMENIVLLAARPDVTSQFHSKVEPQISIAAYIERIAKYFLCSVECYVVGFIYIDRLIKFNPEIAVSKLSVHRIVLVAMTLAAKFHDDNFYTNTYYGKIGGVNLRELNSLEAHFIKKLSWKLNVQPDEYNMYQNMLEKAGSIGTR